MFILPHGIWKDNIRSVNLDWRQRSASRSSEGERSAGLSGERRDLRVTQTNMSCVFSGRRSNTHKGSPLQKKDMRELSLSLSDCIPTSHTSLSKNENINYMFIYLRVLRCLSSGPKYDTSICLYFFEFFYFHLVDHWNGKIHENASPFF